MTLSLEPPAAPPAPVPPPVFARGSDSVRSVLEGPLRVGLALRPVPAPKKMAPFSIAVAAEVSRDGEDVASGRFVVLHDPDGQDGWHGTTRIIAFVEAQVEAEMAADPALSDVGWSWLLEALADHGAAHAAAGGTVTRTVSKRFGQLEETEDDSEVEVRASWTAVHGTGSDGADDLDLGAHLLAWCDLLCSTAGLPPDGVAALPRR